MPLLALPPDVTRGSTATYGHSERWRATEACSGPAAVPLGVAPDRPRLGDLGATAIGLIDSSHLLETFKLALNYFRKLFGVKKQSLVFVLKELDATMPQAKGSANASSCLSPSL